MLSKEYEQNSGSGNKKRLENLSRTTSDLNFSVNHFLLGPRSDTSDLDFGYGRSKEIRALDSWFDNLNTYEDTFEQMAKTKLDSDFAKELDAIDLWFQSISEYEKTASVYSMIPHLNKVQLRFLMKMMQNQMEAVVDSPDKKIISPIGFSKDGSNRYFSRHSFSSSKSESNESKANVDNLNSIFPGEAPPPPGLSFSRISSFSSSFSEHDYENIAQPENNNLKPKPISFAAAARQNPESSPGKVEQKIVPALVNEPVDWDILENVPAWLKGLRLHKYTSIFKGMHWKEIILLNDHQLEVLGVSALGARRKMQKTFEQIRAQMK